MYFNKYKIYYKIPLNENREAEGRFEILTKSEDDVKNLILHKIAENIDVVNKEEIIDILKEMLEQDEFIWVEPKPGVFFCDICGKEIINLTDTIYLFINHQEKEIVDVCEKCRDFALLALSNFKENLIENVKNLQASSEE